MKKQMLDMISGEKLWSHVEYFNTLHRVSGTEDDFKAVDYIKNELDEYGIDNEVFSFISYISHPKKASIEIQKDGITTEMKCKTRAFSATTPSEGIAGSVVYVPTKIPGSGITDGLVGGEIADSDYDDVDVKGKIVLCERGGPDGIKEAQQNGAIGFIHMWASDEDVIHEMIVSPVWGTPTLKDKDDIIKIPVVSVKHSDGLILKEAALGDGLKVTLHTVADTRWRELRLPVATIKGNEEPEKYMLIGGHLDSWHEGITDNATGNSALLELARVFKGMQKELRRSVKIAWWCGHSYGRYSGSTWYSDQNWLDLNKNCVGYINIDSPGCKGATNYSEMTGMAEVEDVVKRAVETQTGQIPTVVRPTRCADQSFNGIGLTSLYLLMGYLPKDEQSSVGGSAGGWWWHSEADTIDKADVNVLVQDTKIYASSAWDMIQPELLPIKLSNMAEDVNMTLCKYESAANSMFCLAEAEEKAKHFADMCRKLEDNMQSGNLCAEGVNRMLLKVSRELNAVLYTVTGKFTQDPATPTPLIPGLYDILRLKKLSADESAYRFCLTGLTREKNRLMYTLDLCSDLIEEFLNK